MTAPCPRYGILPCMARFVLRSVSLAAALVLLLGIPMGSWLPQAEADGVRRVRNQDLPEVVTCAPYAKRDVTHVMSGFVEEQRRIAPRPGERGEPRIATFTKQVFSVAGVRAQLTQRQLIALLKERAGTTRPSTHEVWITAHRDHPWVSVKDIREACASAGIYRVGLRVRHPQGGVYGFPLFLPASVEGAQFQGEGLRMPLHIEGSLNPEDRSHPIALYDAARTAAKLFERPVVAEVRIENHVTVGGAATAIDTLYRAGCRGVRFRTVKGWRPVQDGQIPGTLISIERARTSARELPPEPQRDVEMPIPAPRTAPWPLHGANSPDAFTLELLELPGPGDDQPRRYADPLRVLPNHLRKGAIEPTMMRRVTQWITSWRRDLTLALTKALDEPTSFGDPLAERFRREEDRVRFTTPFRTLYGASRARMRTLDLRVLFVQGTFPVGQGKLTLLLGRDRVEILEAEARQGGLQGGVEVPPETGGANPLSSAVEEGLRVWLEGQLLEIRATGRLRAAAAVDRAMAGLPPNEQIEVRAREPQRQAGLQQFVAQARSLRYDRILVVPELGAAIADAARGVVGRLILGFETEDKTLRINRLEAERFK